MTGWWYMSDPDRVLYRQAAVITAEECGPDNLARADALTGRVVRALVEAGGAGIDPVPLMVNVEFSAVPRLDQSVEVCVEKIRQTGSMLFLRGVLAGDAGTLVSFSAVLKRRDTRG